MADKLTKNLTGLTSPDADDVFPIYDITADDTKKIRVDEIGAVSHVYQKVLDKGSVVTTDTVIADADTTVFNVTASSGVAKKITFTAWITSTFQRIFNKVTALTTAGTLTGSDELVVSQSGVAKKVTFTTLSNDISSGVFDQIDNITTELTTPAKDDYIPVSDTSASGAGKKMLLYRLFSSWSTASSISGNPKIVIHSNTTANDVNVVTLTTLVSRIFGLLPSSTTTSVVGTDYVGYKDTASGDGKKITFTNFVKSVFGGITNQTSKATPIGADEIVIADSASSYGAKKTTLTQLAATSLFTASSLAAIHSQTEKATVVDADEFVINDSAASWGVKKSTFSTLLTWILSKYQSIFDKIADVPNYTEYNSSDWIYLLGYNNDTEQSVKLFPQYINYRMVSSTTTDISMINFKFNPGVLLVDAGSGNRTISLPAAATYKYVQWTVKKIDSSANTVTIDPNASETIDGAATYVLSSQYSTVTFISDGSAWYII